MVVYRNEERIGRLVCRRCAKRREIIYFFWNKSSQQAHQIAVRSGSYIRFHWSDDEDEKSFFELRISSSELTGATMLVITDFAYPDEMADSRGLWDHQIETLRRKLGV